MGNLHYATNLTGWESPGITSTTAVDCEVTYSIPANRTLDLWLWFLSDNRGGLIRLLQRRLFRWLLSW